MTAKFEAFMKSMDLLEKVYEEFIKLSNEVGEMKGELTQEETERAVGRVLLFNKKMDNLSNSIS